MRLLARCRRTWSVLFGKLLPVQLNQAIQLQLEVEWLVFTWHIFQVQGRRYQQKFHEISLLGQVKPKEFFLPTNNKGLE